MEKPIRAYLSIPIIGFSLISYAKAEINLYGNGGIDVFPYQLIVDAGVAANLYSKNKDIQYTFISNYSQQIEEFLLYGNNNKDYEYLKQGCNSNKAENEKAFFCGRVAAIDALTKKSIIVSLESYGYVQRTVQGKIIRLDMQFSYGLLTKDRKTIGIINHQDIKLNEGQSVTLEGWLSPEGNYGARGGKRIEFKVLVKK